jgi:hypothetical protein
LYFKFKNFKNKRKNNKLKNDNKTKNKFIKAVISTLAYNLKDLNFKENNKLNYIILKLILNFKASEHYIYNKD